MSLLELFNIFSKSQHVTKRKKKDRRLSAQKRYNIDNW